MAVLYISLSTLAPAILLFAPGSSFYPLALVTGGMLIILTGFEWWRVGHPLTPAGIMALSGLLLFVLRPLTVAHNGATSAGAALDTRRFIGDTVQAAVIAQAQVVLFFAVFGLVYFYRRFKVQTPEAPEAAEPATDAMVNRAATLLILAVIVAVGCSALLIRSSGGLAAHLDGLSVRNAFLAGRFYLTLGYVPLSVALCLYILVRRRHPRKPGWGPLGVLCALLLLAVAFVTGARGPLLLGAVLPLLLLKQSGSRRLKSGSLALLGVIMIAGAMLVSLSLRENVYDSGASYQALEQDPVGTLMNRLTSGAETRPFDSLILLNEVNNQGDMPHRMGATYASSATWFVPGSLLESKTGGANTWFTKTYMPRFYYPFHVETSISAIGEGFANFGYAGIALIAALLAIAATRIGLRAGPQAVHDTLLAVVLTPLFFSFLRGDSYQNLPLILLVYVGALLGLRFIRSATTAKGPRHRDRRLDPHGGADSGAPESGITPQAARSRHEGLPRGVPS